MYKCKDVLDVFWRSYKWSIYVLCPRGFIEVAATQRLNNLNSTYIYHIHVTHCKLLIYVQLRLLSPDQHWTTLSPNHLTELSILLTYCFGKIDSPLNNRFSDSPILHGQAQSLKDVIFRDVLSAIIWSVFTSFMTGAVII